MTPFSLTITMHSDWHVGSGTGRAELDSIVQRDADDLPYLPAKTLTGILRDGCEQAAQALDGGETGPWNNWLNVLFGDQPALATTPLEDEPRPAIVSIHSAHLDENLRQSLKQKQKLRTAIAFMKPGVAIDPDSGCAKNEYLRFEEMVRQGAVLTAEAQLDFSDAYPDLSPDEYLPFAQGLLTAGAKMVQRLGGKRRRGNGRCEIELNWGDTGDPLVWLKNNYGQVPDVPKLHSENCAVSLNDNDNSLNADGTWVTVPLTLTTQSPLVLPARTVGNLVECLDYIPGRYLLRYLHKKLGVYVNISQAIASNALILTNATREIDNQPGRPTPFCLFGEKLGGGLSKGRKVYNRFQEADPQGIQLKGERGGYLGPWTGTTLPAYKKVDLALYTHNTIKDEIQRPSAEVGGLYSYEAIPAGLTFKAELRVSDAVQKKLSEKVSNWQDLLVGETRIGQSKKDQYGGVEIALASSANSVNTPVVKSQDNSSDNHLYVWFLSDVLMRGDRLNPTLNPDDFTAALEKELGVGLKFRKHPECFSMMLRQRRTESWQVRWGLPRPSLLGWQAGSCLAYKVTGNLDPKKLDQVAIRGIGDRRAEGYGQLSFNDPLLTDKQLSSKERNSDLDKSQQPNSNVVLLSKNSNTQTTNKVPNDVFKYARIIEKAAWREAIQTKAFALAERPETRQSVLGITINGEDSCPPMSQLGGLRSVLGKLRKREDSNAVSTWINALKQVDNRQEKWPGKSLDQIKQLVTDTNQIWQILNLDYQTLTLTDSGTAKLQANLWAEAVRTLVDAMIRAHKRDLEKAQSDN
ncbi:MAG: RAMP superfamily CRISPR-associated protein [Phormidium sp.]